MKINPRSVSILKYNCFVFVFVFTLPNGMSCAKVVKRFKTSENLFGFDF